MRSHVDWLTFTMTPIYQSSYPEGTPMEEQYASAIEIAFMQTFGREMVEKVFGGSWEKNERSRAPYTDSWKMGNGNITLFASQTLTHCTVEISGKGCEELIREKLFDKVLQCVHLRVTRIDIACDIETSTTPTAFVAIVNHERMRASGYQKSETGETQYVGSQKSDRYARVYRYNPPHPRAHLLRVEHVFRKEYAKIVSEQLVTLGMDAITNASGKAFGWAHSDWNELETVSADIAIVSDSRNSGKTIFWLTHSVAPAFRKLVESGEIIDPEEFIRRYFLSQE